MPDDLRALAATLCDRLERQLVGRIKDRCWEETLTDARALRAALAAPETPGYANRNGTSASEEPGFTRTVTPAETGPCYDAHGISRPPNGEVVQTTYATPTPERAARDVIIHARASQDIVAGLGACAEMLREDGYTYSAKVCDHAAAALRATPSEDWGAALRELADIPCDERARTGGAPGDDQYSCYSECVTCRARRAVEALATPSEPSR